MAIVRHGGCFCRASAEADISVTIGWNRAKRDCLRLNVEVGAVDKACVMSSPGPNVYFRNAVLQASPAQLQLMLYDGAIRFALKGREAIEKKDYEQVYESFSRAQRIVLEMESGLRWEVNEELCDQVGALYNFVYRKFIHASIHRDAEAVDDALKILRHQRETWVMLMDRVAKEHPEVPGASSSDASRESCTLSLEG